MPSVMKTDTDRTYEQEEKTAVTRRAPVTLSEHERTDVERKIESDIRHTLFFLPVSWK